MAHFDPSLLATLDEQGRQARLALLAHLGECASCRNRLAAVDPTRMFALLALNPLPETALEALSGRIDAELERSVPGPSWFGRAAAGLAASVLLAGLFGAWVRTHQVAGTQIAENAVRQASATPAASVRLLSPVAANMIHVQAGDTRVTMIFDKALDL